MAGASSLSSCIVHTNRLVFSRRIASAGYQLIWQTLCVLLPDTAAPVASDRPALLCTQICGRVVDQLTEPAQLANYAEREPSCSKAVSACGSGRQTVFAPSKRCVR